MKIRSFINKQIKLKLLYQNLYKESIRNDQSVCLKC